MRFERMRNATENVDNVDKPVDNIEIHRQESKISQEMFRIMFSQYWI